ncbi:Ltp family lipoprotein [Kandleria sp.]|uniref:Ltp family lipoprotein n=1 Tax=Kandleria sp. TaxID=2774291 RepID=UPI001B414904|nr:Ltp family lipoprotein [Kandleria sp.]MBP3276419.1 Ltp family lipoprotein [Kandleria sp.]
MKLFKSIAIVIAMLMAISTVSFNQVVEVDAAAMKLNYSKKDLQVKKSFTLKVKNAKKKKIKWSSSKKKIAKVSKKGKVTGLKEGKAIITAKIGKKKLKCTVTVLTKAHYKAVKAAKNWVKNNKGLSRDQLMNLLVGADKLSKANAKYAINHSGINWNKNAAEFAEEYIKDNTDEVDDSRRDVLKEYLTINGFTSSEADYAVKHAKIDWKKEAVKLAKFFLKYNAPDDVRRKDVEEELANAHYTKDEIQYAINNCGINWNKKDVEYAEKYIKDNTDEDAVSSRDLLKEELTLRGFTSSEADYAVKNAKIDWKKEAVKYAKYFLKYEASDDVSRKDVEEELAKAHFTKDEIQYATNNCGVDWKSLAYKSAKYFLETSYYVSRENVEEELANAHFTKDEIQYAIDNCGDEWISLAYKSAKDYLIENPSYTEKELIDMIKEEDRGLTDADISAGVKQALSELES